MDSKLPAEEKTLLRLGDEAATTGKNWPFPWSKDQLLTSAVAAGTLTTAWTLSVVIYYLLTMPELLRKLKTELAKAVPDPSTNPPLTTVENLPYLTACVQEAIRLGYGASGRIQNIAPEETMVLRRGTNEWTIPPGTPTSMSIMLLHHDETIYPDSYSFHPERWLENPRLDKFLYSFGKGTRQCVGINLAYAELYLTLAKIFLNYGSPDVRFPTDQGVLQLFETEYRDVQCCGDMFVPKMWKGTKGVRIQVLA